MPLTDKESLLDRLAARVRDDLFEVGASRSHQMAFLKARIALEEAWEAGYDEAVIVLG